MFTDIVGYTALMGDYEQKAFELLILFYQSPKKQYFFNHFPLFCLFCYFKERQHYYIHLFRSPLLLFFSAILMLSFISPIEKMCV